MPPDRGVGSTRKASQSRVFPEARRISSSSSNRSSAVRLSVGSAGIRAGRMRRKTRLTVVIRLSRKAGPSPGNIARSSSRVFTTRPGISGASTSSSKIIQCSAFPSWSRCLRTRPTVRCSTLSA